MPLTQVQERIISCDLRCLNENIQMDPSAREQYSDGTPLNNPGYYVLNIAPVPGTLVKKNSEVDLYVVWQSVKEDSGSELSSKNQTQGSVLSPGWGPDRPTFTMALPPDHIVFNSITDNNQEVGDERYFTSASKYTGIASKNYWTDYNFVDKDEEYVVRIYVNNNAADNLNLTATDVRAYIAMQEAADYRFTISAKLFSNNASPDTVWDSTSFYSNRKFIMTYIPGTLKYHNLANIEGFPMTNAGSPLYAFQKQGIPLGYDEMNGSLASGGQYSGYLTFHVRPIFE